jgi:U3 small nucleolar RNA-associated protein 22
MPSDAAAFAKTKAALGVQLANALAAACGAHATATEEAVEVLWQGFAFKLLLFMDRWVKRIAGHTDCTCICD